MTLEEKCQEIKVELATMVAQLNESDDAEIALLAQTALVQVDALSIKLGDYGLGDGMDYRD